MKQTHGQKTREKILTAGVKLWPDISLSKVARACGMTHAAVLYHYPGDSLKGAIATYAVEQRESRVIVQLIAEKHPAIEHLSHGERAAHFFND